MDPTTLDALESAFETAIKAISPTHTREQGTSWAPYRGEVTDSPPPTANRLFSLIWGDEEFAPAEEAFFGKSAYTLDSPLVVETAYTMDSRTGDLVVAADHQDLFHTLQNLASSTTGLHQVFDDGREDEIDDSGHASTVKHKFVIRNMRERI